MEEYEKDIDLIEAFFQEKLKENELASFIQRRKDDPAFDEEVEDYILIFQGLKTHGEKNFSQTLQNWEKDIEAARPSKIVPMRRYLAIAATLLILLIPITYWFISEYTTSKGHETLFVSYFQPYDDVISVRSDNVSNLALGMSAYNERNYEKAIEYLQLLKGDIPQKNAADLYLGISYLAINKTDSAQVIFSSLRNGDAGLFKEIAEWNLALTYLKDGNEEAVRGILNSIMAEDTHLFKAESEALLNALD